MLHKNISMQYILYTEHIPPFPPLLSLNSCTPWPVVTFTPSLISKHGVRYLYKISEPIIRKIYNIVFLRLNLLNTGMSAYICFPVIMYFVPYGSKKSIIFTG